MRVRRAHTQPHSSRWTARTGRVERRERLTGSADSVVPRWHRRGAYVAASRAGWRKTKTPAANGRWAAAASGGANHGDTGESEHAGWLHGTRGDEPTARIRRRELDGGGLRRRPPAERKGENGDEVTRGRFPAARASTRLRESVPCAGLGGNASREAGDERRFRARAASTRRATAKVGAASASYGEATLTRADGAKRDRFGLGPRKRRGRARPESPSASSLVPAPPTRATTIGDGEQGRQWRGGEDENEGDWRREELGFIGATMSVWERGTDIGRSSRRAGARLAAKTTTGGGGREGDEEEPCLLSLEARAGRGGAESMTTAMTAGRAAGPGGTDGAGAARAATTRARAREQRRAGADSAGGELARDGGGKRERESEGGGTLGAAHAHARAARGQSGERGRERERERGREGDGPRGIRPIEPGGGEIDFCGGIDLEGFEFGIEFDDRSGI
uniref:Epstein-Barr virus EBNA-1-like protein n=1 Tax=Oryza sativa subsp. japonica TaxID=39947 RepID=Q8W5G0_ORYSJ|nr:Epstein-Barr virus EBNA-1-like protein [Oryza sativa Japonica Group]